MTIDEMQEMVAPTETLHERVTQRQKPVAVTLVSQYLGNRIVSHVYPEHYAKVVLARYTMLRYFND